MDERASDDVALGDQLAARRCAVLSRSRRTVNPAPRDRVTIDLRGLGPALKAHARARDLRVSDVARMALVAALKTAESEAAVQVTGLPDAAGDGTVQLTIRLRRGVAARLTARARACGLSKGAYLMTLIDEVPAPPRAVATALGTSTERLAVVSWDLNQLIRTLRRDTTSSSRLIDDWLRPALGDVRRHLGLASRLMSELRPRRSLSAQQRNEPGDGLEARP